MIWEEVYESGHEELAPWDEVVSFVYRNKVGENSNNHICEVGFGTGNNLKFLHDQGFRVYGIEQSYAATAKALEKVNSPRRILQGDYRVLPFDSNSFDLLVDRAALWYVDSQGIKDAISEIHRVLKPNGKFFFTPCYENADERFPIHYVQSVEEIEEFLPAGNWTIESIDNVAVHDVLVDKSKVSYFRVTARKNVHEQS